MRPSEPGRYVCTRSDLAAAMDTRPFRLWSSKRDIERCGWAIRTFSRAGVTTFLSAH